MPFFYVYQLLVDNIATARSLTSTENGYNIGDQSGYIIWACLSLRPGRPLLGQELNCRRSLQILLPPHPFNLAAPRRLFISSHFVLGGFVSCRFSGGGNVIALEKKKKKKKKRKKTSRRTENAAIQKAKTDRTQADQSTQTKTTIPGTSRATTKHNSKK